MIYYISRFPDNENSKRLRAFSIATTPATGSPAA